MGRALYGDRSNPTGTYRLEDNNGNALTNTWNIEQLRHFPPKFGLTAF